MLNTNSQQTIDMKLGDFLNKEIGDIFTPVFMYVKKESTIKGFFFNINVNMFWARLKRNIM